jgi:hypothetical protein
MSVFDKLFEQGLIPTKLNEFAVNILCIESGNIWNFVIKLGHCDFHEVRVEFTQQSDVEVGDIEFRYLVSKQK